MLLQCIRVLSVDYPLQLCHSQARPHGPVGVIVGDVTFERGGGAVVMFSQVESASQ